LLFMPVLTQSFFAFMSGHFMSFPFFSAGHINYFMLFFTFDTNVFAGLNDGILCAGIMIVVFLEMFLAVFSALRLTTKLPKPLRYTFLPSSNESLTVSMKASTVF